MGSIPGMGKFPGEGNGYPLLWRIPWTEEPGGGCGPRGRKQMDMADGLSTQTQFMWTDMFVKYFLKNELQEKLNLKNPPNMP